MHETRAWRKRRQEEDDHCINLEITKAAYITRDKQKMEEYEKSKLVQQQQQQRQQHQTTPPPAEQPLDVAFLIPLSPAMSTWENTPYLTAEGSVVSNQLDTMLANVQETADLLQLDTKMAQEAEEEENSTLPSMPYSSGKDVEEISLGEKDKSMQVVGAERQEGTEESASAAPKPISPVKKTAHIMVGWMDASNQRSMVSNFDRVFGGQAVLLSKPT